MIRRFFGLLGALCILGHVIGADAAAFADARAPLPVPVQVRIGTDALSAPSEQAPLHPLLTRYSPASWIRTAEGAMRYKRRGLLTHDETIAEMHRRLEVGIHTDTGAGAFKDQPLELLVAIAEMLLHRGRMPAVDRIDLLEALRARPRFDRDPIIFLLHNGQGSAHPMKTLLEEADRAARAGANILVAASWPPDMLRFLRDHYPHIVLISEVTHVPDMRTTLAALHDITDRQDARAGRPDGLMLKKYADWAAHAGGPLAIATIRENNPDLVLMVAGGILSTGELATKTQDVKTKYGLLPVADTLSRPERLVPAVGNDGKTLAEILLKDRRYARDLQDLGRPYAFTGGFVEKITGIVRLFIRQFAPRAPSDGLNEAERRHRDQRLAEVRRHIWEQAQKQRDEPWLRALAVSLMSVVSRLPALAERLVNEYVALARRRGLSPGTVELYLTGGRLKQKALREKTDLDVKFHVIDRTQALDTQRGSLRVFEHFYELAHLPGMPTLLHFLDLGDHPAYELRDEEHLLLARAA